jgi:hypothetical protein
MSTSPKAEKTKFSAQQQIEALDEVMPIVLEHSQICSVLGQPRDVSNLLDRLHAAVDTITFNRDNADVIRAAYKASKKAA